MALTKKIAVDLFGAGDISEMIRACVIYSNARDDIELHLAGDFVTLSEALAEHNYESSRIVIVPATATISRDEDPLLAVMTKRSSSLTTAVEIAKDKSFAGVISVGSPRALYFACAGFFGLFNGLKAPTLATLLPTHQEKYAILLDSGLNVDITVEDFVRYALLGVALSESCGIEYPSVALITPDGNEKVIGRVPGQLNERLKRLPIVYSGCVSASEALSGKYDVLIGDGMTGSALLGGIDSTALFIATRLCAHLKTLLPDEFDPVLVDRATEQSLDHIRQSLRQGAVMLGVKKPIVIIQDDRSEQAMLNAFRMVLNMHSNYYERRMSAMASLADLVLNE